MEKTLVVTLRSLPSINYAECKVHDFITLLGMEKEPTCLGYLDFLCIVPFPSSTPLPLLFALPQQKTGTGAAQSSDSC